MKSGAFLRSFVALFMCAAMLGAHVGAAGAADKRAVVRQARQSYYSLHALGFESFECAIRPNWNLLLAGQRKAEPQQTNTALKTLERLRFTIDLNPDGSVKFSHNELPGQNREMKDALQQIFDGMEQTMSGFFDTWKLFVLDSPFPEPDADFQLQDMGALYRITYRDGSADVTTTMTKDFAIADLNVASPEFVSSIRPHFTKLPDGWLLNAYEASYRSDKPEEATELKVAVRYGPVNGLQTIEKLNLSGTYGATAFDIELAFADCTLTKKH